MRGMETRRVFLVGILIAGSVLTASVGCQAAVPSAEPQALPTRALSDEAGSEPSSEDEAIALAKASLIEQLDVKNDGISVVEVERVDWPDASLGCPEEGMMYAQMIVPGYTVVVEVGGKTHNVHVGDGRAVVCPE